MIREELKWLKDPEMLAKRVLQLLKEGKIAFGVGMLRQAQVEKRKNVEWAWNILLRFCFERDAPDAAYKFYNDMKKRGCRPDLRCYTIMLNGFAGVKNRALLNPVKVALSIYQSTTKADSKFEPSIIHSNAMLKVCAAHSDMATMWKVAGDLPETGPSSPNNPTYNTILQALINVTKKDVEAMDPTNVDEIMARKAEAFMDGKRMWGDIVYRWKTNQLVVDSMLASMMAKLMKDTATSDHDLWEVFALLKQTYGIPILMDEPPKPVVEKPKATPPPPTDIVNEEDYVPLVEEGELEEPFRVEEAEEEEESFEDLFAPVVNVEGSVVKKHFAPDNYVLMTILETCIALTQGVGPGKRYWEHLTDPKNERAFQPDRLTYNNYMRLLRLSRSSRMALELVQEMVSKKQAEGKLFHIALTVCLRDRRNCNVFKTANEIMRLLGECLVLTDERALMDYMRLADILAETPQTLAHLNGLDDAGKKSENGGGAGVVDRQRAKMLTIAAEQLLSHITKLDKAVDHYVLQENALPARTHEPRIDRSRADPVRAIRGSDAHRVLAHAGLFLREVLKKYQNEFPTATRCAIQDAVDSLKKYSQQEVMLQCQKRWVSPTPEQLREYQLRVNGPITIRRG
ncbi:hypothetical protein BO70DRAFT_297120 [Aspergillus heteromorphus CBS 117.55]|uniref:Pentatricopeptide repeat protein n=1 Tax=Aspergillus heteromorphus CBS 117.55 TaxID=1448321 RepID=A0A317VJM2_9EURO|nr:uncharacterized protein BO70DRAFT_297120 [Aspergillus heteromorphus CBS 117.55]PWY73639.1 hypothetical protein BO70DRAFT_297120 [Aspergillus heteromorphus CBS 117.55]